MSIHLSLFWLFVRLGFLSFGGGYPMMALIFQQANAAVGLTAAEFADMAALELLASGPIAINAATYVGYIRAGFSGAAVATLGVCVSPFVLTTILYFFLRRFQESRYVQGFLSAIKIACGGLLLATVFTLAHNIFLFDAGFAALAADPLGSVQWLGLLICAVCVVAIRRFKANPIVMILVSAALGAVLLS